MRILQAPLSPEAGTQINRNAIGIAEIRADR
jgi:hypothetical protein